MTLTGEYSSPYVTSLAGGGSVESLIRARFGVREGGFVFIEDTGVFHTLVATGILPEGLTIEALHDGSVVVGLDTDETDFVDYDASPQLEAFLRNAYLMALKPDGLALTDPRPLYDLLREALPVVRDSVPTINHQKLWKRYRPGFLGFGGARSRLLPLAQQALEKGISFCGMFSVCNRDGEPACYSTYAWMEEGVCLFMATYDGYLSFELFPFRVIK